MTKRRTAAIGVVLIGLIVTGLSSALPSLLPSHFFWGPEQAAEQSTAAARLHQVTHQTAHTLESAAASQADKVHAQQELAAAQARYDASRAQLDRAQFWRRTVPRVCRWFGGSLVVVGLFVIMATPADKR